jgi:hypothetical protein
LRSLIDFSRWLGRQEHLVLVSDDGQQLLADDRVLVAKLGAALGFIGAQLWEFVLNGSIYRWFDLRPFLMALVMAGIFMAALELYYSLWDRRRMLFCMLLFAALLVTAADWSGRHTFGLF